MKNITRLFEKIIICSLLILMSIAIFVSTIELGIILYEQLLEPPFLLLNINEMLEVFGFFLMVLIGLELFETIKAYLDGDQIHVEIVFLVALVAVARKIIIIDYEKYSPELLLGISSLIIALAVGFYLVKYTLAKFTPIHPLAEKTEK
jgi:uncharacterized membrane protein (DUF373 family)